MSRVVLDSQPQFVLVHQGRVCRTWSGTLEELKMEAHELAERLGVSVEDLAAHYRVMVTATSPWVAVGDEVDWDEVRAAWREWDPPEDATATVWDGSTY